MKKKNSLLMYFLFCISLLVLCSCQRVSPFWPQPRQFDYKGNQTWLIHSVDQINFNVMKNQSQEVPSHVTDLIDFYKKQIFETVQPIPQSKQTILGVQNTLNIYILDWGLYFSTNDSYSLNFQLESVWDLHCNTYTGLARALETFSQVIQHENNTFKMINMPMSLKDFSAFDYRGVMIDTSRHFIPVEILLQNLDAMMYNKMNTFHWHITDDDSFPLEVQAYPDLAANTKFGEKMTYSAQQVQEIIAYGIKRGVRVIPEIDTPAHSYSWGKTQALSNITLLCQAPIYGQFDPTLNETYEAVKKIFTQINSQFSSEFIHFGGDEANNSCWDQRPSIKNFMQQNNISSYQDLQIYYRKRQRQIFRNQIQSNKTIMYWADEAINLPVENGDVIQWWGHQKNISLLSNFTNDIVVSSYDVVYLDLGFGRYNGDMNSQAFKYNTWRDIYTQFQTDGYQNFKGKVIGGETCMWSEVNNPETTLNKIWIRTSALAERLWNPTANSSTLYHNSINLVTRLVAQQRRMNTRGINTIPVTDELCANDPPVCFTNH